MARYIWAKLDGLRGIAVPAVDVVFCLSGFLITKLLLEKHQRAGGVDLRVFYLRRMLRLFPALVGLAAVPALLLLLLVIVVVPDPLPARWMTGVTGIAGLLAVLVVTGVVLASGSRVTDALSWPMLTWVGRRSYGLYLYCFPIIGVFLHHVRDPAGRTERAAAPMAVSVPVAAESYRSLEQPFLRLKSLITDRSVPTTSGPDPDGALGAPVSA